VIDNLLWRHSLKQKLNLSIHFFRSDEMFGRLLGFDLFAFRMLPVLLFHRELLALTYIFPFFFLLWQLLLFNFGLLLYGTWRGALLLCCYIPVLSPDMDSGSFLLLLDTMMDGMLVVLAGGVFILVFVL